MGDPHNRKNLAVSRLRHQLRKKRESLADHFEFKMYIAFHFKEKKKNCALFEVAEVVPVMTNNYEDSILKGVKEEAYTYESSKELLEKDVVQLHAPRWQSMRRDVLGCTTEMDFFLWPRSDIDKIECMLFSKWKGDESPFKPIQAEFRFDHADYEKQLMRLLTKKERSGLIINNPDQSMFLFIDKNQLQTSKNKVIVFKLSSMCLYLPQDQLTSWGPGTAEELLSPLMAEPQSEPQG
ncbi:uncharacterized protein C6orf62 homolog [Pecten maximus]|uniref:uncharacterized protein C6orf62 homolog n=1 Tax=Pecten maximus TaxID=6579 RepID=UPI0014587723|nr:uncharacterized protein C6orf62 homolog [Pecten maximus]XP_033737815.1 uncharacterized protein C6orf62 homolog [Pecten maximus]